MRLLRLFAIGLAAWLGGLAQVQAQTQGVWQDSHTGLAIAGYDPVANWIRRKPVEGAAAHEFRWAGAVWRFANEGNKQAFMRNPTVYAPRFFGYDPRSLASGRTVRGAPEFWAVRGNRLYLFHSRASFRAFLDDANGTLVKARGHWPRLARTLPEAYWR